MVAIPQYGELRGLRLAELLLDLERASFVGSLQLARGRLSKTLLFREGEPVYAESNLASESLGIQLLDAGLLDRAQHLEVSKHMAKHHCKEGAALLDLEFLDARGLFAALKGQVRTRILQCFSWRDGSFTIDPDTMPSVDTQPFRAGVPQLVQEGLETNWSAERIRAGLALELDCAVLPTSRLAAFHPQLTLDADVRRFLAEVESGSSLGDLLESVRSKRALAAIWVMFRAAVLRGKSSKAGSPETPAPPRPNGGAASEKSHAATGSVARPTATETGELRDAIQQTFAGLSELDDYSLLGVDRSATSEAIRSAYLKAATRFHPDALVRTGLDATTGERASTIFAALGKARAQLTDPKRRREYDATLGEQAGAQQEGERALAAETSYRKGEILMQQGNFRGAVSFFEASISVCCDEPVYLSALGWALFKQNPPDVPRAREHLERASGLAPNDREIARRLDQLKEESSPGRARSA